MFEEAFSAGGLAGENNDSELKWHEIAAVMGAVSSFLKGTTQDWQ